MLLVFVLLLLCPLGCEEFRQATLNPKPEKGLCRASFNRLLRSVGAGPWACQEGPSMKWGLGFRVYGG